MANWEWTKYYTQGITTTRVVDIYKEGRQKCLMLLHQDMVIVKELWFFLVHYGFEVVN